MISYTMTLKSNVNVISHFLPDEIIDIIRSYAIECVNILHINKYIYNRLRVTELHTFYYGSYTMHVERLFSGRVQFLKLYINNIILVKKWILN